MLENKILGSVKYVVENSNHVKINREKIDSFTDTFRVGDTVHWINFAPFNIFNLNLSQQVTFMIIMSATSFSYWGTPKWTIKYKGQELDGAYGMVSALGKAIENGYPILNPSYLSQIPEEDYRKVLEGNVEIPLFFERLNIVREIGNVLNNVFKKDFLQVIEQMPANTNLLNIIIDNFPCFTDKSMYKNKEVLFYKKAQLLTSDLIQIISQSENCMKLFSSLTACADYKLPQVLREFGLIEYSDFLANRVDQRIEIPKDSEEEVEIRANTIWVIELIKQQMEKRFENINSMIINDQIWLLSQNNSKMKPYHLTRTTAY